MEDFKDKSFRTCNSFCTVSISLLIRLPAEVYTEQKDYVYLFQSPASGLKAVHCCI